jgi:hypothetical protein
MKIGWTQNGDDGKLYGVAHGANGKLLGAVRIDERPDGAYAVAYNLPTGPFGNKVSSTRITRNTLKRSAESCLNKLLAA